MEKKDGNLDRTEVVSGELMPMEPARLVSQWSGALPARPVKAPGPGTVGTLDWVARNLYGGPSQFVELVWALLASEGREADGRWKKLVNLYLGWCEAWELRGEGDPPTLNETAVVLKVNLRELLGWLAQSVTAVMSVVAKQRIGMAALELTNASIESALGPDGFKDRQMLLATIGAVQPATGGPSVTINNSQQVAVVGKEQMRTPLLRFRETTEAIDESVRGGGE